MIVIPLTAGTYQYVASSQGAQVGKTTVVVTRNGDGTTTITEDGAGTYQGMAGSAKATLSLAPDLTPTAYGSTIDVAGSQITPSAAFTPTGATMMGGISEGSATLAAGHRFVVIDGGLLDGFIALPAQVAAWPGATIDLLAPVYGRSAEFGITANAAPARPQGVPANDVALSADAGNIPLVEWYDPATMIVDRIDIPGQGLSVVRQR